MEGGSGIERRGGGRHRRIGDRRKWGQRRKGNRKGDGRWKKVNKRRGGRELKGNKRSKHRRKWGGIIKKGDIGGGTDKRGLEGK